jgi:hypothetical protein
LARFSVVSRLPPTLPSLASPSTLSSEGNARAAVLV